MNTCSLDVFHHDDLRVGSVWILLRVRLQDISLLFVLLDLGDGELLTRVASPLRLAAV